MSMNKVEEMVVTFLNGNTSDFKIWLKKKATKIDIIDTISFLGSYYGGERDGYNYIRAMDKIRSWLES